MTIASIIVDPGTLTQGLRALDVVEKGHGKRLQALRKDAKDWVLGQGEAYVQACRKRHFQQEDRDGQLVWMRVPFTWGQKDDVFCDLRKALEGQGQTRAPS